MFGDIFHKICPALSIKIIARIIPKKDRGAKVLPAILEILLLEVTTPSIIKTPRRIPTIAMETVLVVLKGEIKTAGFRVVVKMAVGSGIGVGGTKAVAVGVGATGTAGGGGTGPWAVGRGGGGSGCFGPEKWT